MNALLIVASPVLDLITCWENNLHICATFPFQLRLINDGKRRKAQPLNTASPQMGILETSA